MLTKNKLCEILFDENDSLHRESSMGVNELIVDMLPKLPKLRVVELINRNYELSDGRFRATEQATKLMMRNYYDLRLSLEEKINSDINTDITGW